VEKDSVQSQVEFKIGETVRFSVTGTSATVLGIERYRVPGRVRVLYKIKLHDGIRTAKQDELERFEEFSSKS
jgi:hypothetical protein